tara:strand:+ start:1506 stop:1688 length:183 start_codon:yes stop_codon:yes gene_type:complete
MRAVSLLEKNAERRIRIINRQNKIPKCTSSFKKKDPPIAKTAIDSPKYGEYVKYLIKSIS